MYLSSPILRDWVTCSQHLRFYSYLHINIFQPKFMVIDDSTLIHWETSSFSFQYYFKINQYSFTKVDDLQLFQISSTDKFTTISFNMVIAVVIVAYLDREREYSSIPSDETMDKPRTLSCCFLIYSKAVLKFISIWIGLLPFWVSMWMNLIHDFILEDICFKPSSEYFSHWIYLSLNRPSLSLSSITYFLFQIMLVSESIN